MPAGAKGRCRAGSHAAPRRGKLRHPGSAPMKISIVNPHIPVFRRNYAFRKTRKWQPLSTAMEELEYR